MADLLINCSLLSENWMFKCNKEHLVTKIKKKKAKPPDIYGIFLAGQKAVLALKVHQRPKERLHAIELPFAPCTV